MVTLTEAQMPNHHHTFTVSAEDGERRDPTGRYFGRGTALYSAPNSLMPMAEQTLPDTGGSQAHNNMQPFLTMNYIIALVGLYPSRS
jgi:microcystin-dependent protein